MSENFFDYFTKVKIEKLLEFTRNEDETVVLPLLSKESFSLEEVALLLSKGAVKILENLAVKSAEITFQKFGKTILLYIPLYLSNVCINACRYCGFSKYKNGTTLTFEEVKKEADIIYKKGFRHILLVAGENPSDEFWNLLLNTVEYLRPKFASVCIEIAPQSEENYRILIEKGVDCITIYQETYHRQTYKYMHPIGPKADYKYRLLTPERAAKAGMRKINLGALLGLYKWKYEFLSMYLHYEFLRKRYWKVAYSISFPRLKEFGSSFKTPYPVSDLELVHMILVARIVMPEVNLVLSTREPANIRDNLIGLGITQMSAESKTEPGGYLYPDRAKKQFEIADNRSLEEIVSVIKNKGFDPVFKDWQEVCYG